MYKIAMDSEQTTTPLKAFQRQPQKYATTVITTGPPKWRSSRFILAYMIMWANGVIFLQRVSFSMVIVCMVNHTALDLLSTTTQRGIPLQALADLNKSSGAVNTKNQTLGFPAWTAVLHTAEDVVHDADVSRRAMGYNVTLLKGPSRPDDGMHNYTEQSKHGGGVGEAGKRDKEDCDRAQRATDSSEEKEDGPFVWSKETQGLLLGAVYWGYMSTQVLASYVFHLLGPRRLCAASMLLMSTFTMLCHPAAFWSAWAVFAIRVAVGVCTSFIIPSLLAMWVKWAPTAERATLVSLSFSGQNVANAVSFPISALLCKYGFAGGWPSVFYVYGILGVVWCLVWLLVVADSPETLGSIHPDEKQHILAHRGQIPLKGEKLNVPWCSIFSSMCFWALAAAHITFTWGLFLFMSNLPLYMYEVMNFDIKSNGLFSMLPYIALAIVQMLAGFVSDRLVKRKLLSVFYTRRVFCAVSNLLPACCLLVLSYLDCKHVAAVMILLVLAVGFTGCALAVILVNPFDIAPKYAISIMSVTNTMACIPGIVTPYVVAELTPDKSREQWQRVFFITVGVFVLGTIFFCVFARTSLQSWSGAPAPSHELVVPRNDDNDDDDGDGQSSVQRNEDEKEQLHHAHTHTAKGCV